MSLIDELIDEMESGYSPKPRPHAKLRLRIGSLLDWDWELPCCKAYGAYVKNDVEIGFLALLSPHGNVTARELYAAIVKAAWLRALLKAGGMNLEAEKMESGLGRDPAMVVVVGDTMVAVERLIINHVYIATSPFGEALLVDTQDNPLLARCNGCGGNVAEGLKHLINNMPLNRRETRLTVVAEPVKGVYQSP